jgi:hypothetical protein
MSIEIKRRIVFIILELISGITIGLFTLSLSEKLWKFTDSMIVVFLFVYIISIIGIAVPGYFYLKLYGNKEVYIGAIFSSIVWAFFGIFAYIILTYFIGIAFLSTMQAGLIFPLIFGVIGFNHFAFGIKKYTSD